MLSSDPPNVTSLMEAASEALSRMDYAGCERHCLEAIAIVRTSGAWMDYARIMLPLQEARRQRRMSAAEGAIQLGTGEDEGPARWIGEHAPGCLVVTSPGEAGRESAERAWRQVLERGVYAQVLYADNESDAGTWRLRPFVSWRERTSGTAWRRGSDLAAAFPAPPAEMRRRALSPSDRVDDRTAAEWFIDASESLGDAVLATVAGDEPPRRRVERLEACVEAAGDHELAHQALLKALQELAASVAATRTPTA